MSNFTPGPWEVEKNGYHWTVRAPLEICGHMGTFELCRLSSGNDPKQEADARLIAASPELKENLRNVVVAAKVLLEALVLVQGWANLPFGPFGTDKIIKKAEDLLRKIEGEEETE